MHKEQIILLTDPVYSWETEKQWIWQDDAACAFSPSTMFEVAREGDPIFEDSKFSEIQDLNENNLRAAQKICGKCPVWDQCYISANEPDFKWTMRAGIMPTAHTENKSGDPKKALGRPIKNHLCPQGHSDWVTDNRGHRRCQVCSAIRSQAQAEAKRLKNAKDGRSKKQRVGVERGVKCGRGHDEWRPRAGRDTFDCLPCRREADATRQRRKREAAKLAG